MFGFSWTTQRKLTKVGEVPEQRIKLEGEAKAHLIEWPSPSGTFHVDLEEFLTMRFLWPSGSVLYEGGSQGGQPQGQGKVFLEDGTLWYEGEFWSGTMNGQGTLYREDGSILYQGEFSEGLISNGQEYYPDGAVKYKGEFANGVYSGRGKLYYPDGQLHYEGVFYEGLFSEKAGSLHRVESCSTKDIFVRDCTTMKEFSLPITVRYFMPESLAMVNW